MFSPALPAILLKVRLIGKCYLAHPALHPLTTLSRMAVDLRLVQRFPGAVSADDEFSHAVEYAKTQVRNCYDGEASPRDGRLAQLVRAPALQAGSRGFESLTAHQINHRK